jgi:hypothetical protein
VRERRRLSPPPLRYEEEIDAGDFIPHMEGREVFKSAVSKMPEAVRAVCEEVGVAVTDIDLLFVHQANLRIIEGVAKQLGLPPEKVPHNIERYGNTTAGTLPILYHECLKDGRVKPGMLLCFTALGSGLHWGAALYRDRDCILDRGDRAIMRYIRSEHMQLLCIEVSVAHHRFELDPVGSRVDEDRSERERSCSQRGVFPVATPPPMMNVTMRTAIA